MFNIFLTGLWFGLVFNIAPGAVFTESLRRGIIGGFRPALNVQIGSLVGDAVWAVAGLAGAAAVLTQPRLAWPLTMAGCGVLLFLGVKGIWSALMPSPQPVDNRASTQRNAVLAGAAMSTGNVWNVVYWGGVGGAVVGSFGDTAPILGTSIFFGAFMISSVAWCFICAGIIATLRRVFSARAIRLTELGASVALIVMAITFGVNALR